MASPCKTEPDSQPSEIVGVDVSDRKRVDQDNGVCVVSGVRRTKFQEREMTEQAAGTVDVNLLFLAVGFNNPQYVSVDVDGPDCPVASQHGMVFY